MRDEITGTSRSPVAAGVALIAATYGLARFGYGLTLPGIRADLGLSGALAGAIAAGGFVVYCAAAAVAAALVRRDRPRRVLALAGATAGLGALGVAAAQAPGALAVAVLVAGAGAGLASPALVEVVGRTVAAGRRDRAQAVVNAGTGVGVLVAGPVVLLLGGGWRAAWVLFALLSAAAAAWALRRTRDLPPGASRPRRAARPPGSVGAHAPAVVAALLVGAGSAGAWTFGLDRVTAAGGLAPVGATLFWTLLGAAGVLGAASGDLARRMGVRRAWTLTALVAGAATLGLGLAPGVLPVALACGAAFGGAYVAMSGVLIAWGARLAPGAAAGATAVLFAALAIGQALGSVVLGMAIDGLGGAGAFVLAAGLAVAGCVPALAGREVDGGSPGRVPATRPPGPRAQRALVGTEGR